MGGGGGIRVRVRGQAPTNGLPKKKKNLRKLDSLPKLLQDSPAKRSQHMANYSER